MGIPRSSAFQRSARVPPMMVMGAENAIPSMARPTKSVAMFFATAQGITNTTAIAALIRYK